MRGPVDANDARAPEVRVQVLEVVTSLAITHSFTPPACGSSRRVPSPASTRSPRVSAARPCASFSESRGASLPGQRRQQRLQVPRIRPEGADAVPVDQLHHRVVDGRLDPALASLLRDVAVEVVDLGAAALQHVLQERRPAAGDVLGAGLQVALDGLETVSRRGVDEPLRVDAVDRLHLVARGAAHRDGLGSEVDRDLARYGLAPDLGRAEPAQAGHGVGHAVHGELGPALAPEIGGHLSGGDVTEDPGEFARPRGIRPVVLADLEADRPRVRAHRVAGLVHAGADGDDAAERALPTRHRRHTLVVDPVLEVHQDAVRLLEVGQAELGRPLGVVRLHGDEHGVEGRGEALDLVDVERLDRDEVLAAGAAELEPPRLHRLHVLRPLIDEGHVVAGLGQEPADDASDGTRPDDPDPRAHVFPLSRGILPPGPAPLPWPREPPPAAMPGTSCAMEQSPKATAVDAARLLRHTWCMVNEMTSCGCCRAPGPLAALAPWREAEITV